MPEDTQGARGQDSKEQPLAGSGPLGQVLLSLERGDLGWPLLRQTAGGNKYSGGRQA